MDSTPTGVPDAALGFRLKVVARRPDVVYAATGKGLYRSTDGGLTFSRIDAADRLRRDLANPEAASWPTWSPTSSSRCPDGATRRDPATVQVVAAVGWRAGNKRAVDRRSRRGARQRHLHVRRRRHARSRRSTRARPPASPRPARPDGDVQGKIGRIELGRRQRRRPGPRLPLRDRPGPAGFKNGQSASIDVPDESPAKGVTTTYSARHLRLARLRQDVDAARATRRRSQPPDDRLGAERHRLRGALYCPGVQAWYNQWIEPDPTRPDGDGVPTRLAFGLEEVWENEQTPANDLAGRRRPARRDLQGRRPLLRRHDLPVPEHRPARAARRHRPPTNRRRRTPTSTRRSTCPRPAASVALVVGNDGGVLPPGRRRPPATSTTTTGAAAARPASTRCSPTTRNVAKDGTIYSGLQDNGEMHIDPDGKQFGIYGGDGGFSAVDPDDSDIAYEEYTNGDMRATTRRRQDVERHHAARRHVPVHRTRSRWTRPTPTT